MEKGLTDLKRRYMNMNKEEWTPKDIFSREEMDRRIKNIVTSFRGWTYIIKLFRESGVQFDKLQVAEVGCGTGTFSLTLALLGAKVTLIDFNQKALENAGRIYKLYNCNAELIKADCLYQPPKELVGRYDFVSSIGLAEHFIGEDRYKCLSYHYELLKGGGVIYIGVPNKYSPFYQWIKFFRKITGTWDIDIEIPFSSVELRILAKKLGCREFAVVGNHYIWRDFIVYSRGFISAITDIFPQKIKVSIKRYYKVENKKEEIGNATPNNRGNMVKELCLNAVAKADSINMPESIMADIFSGGIILIGIK